MNAVLFDTHAFVKRLTAVGMPEAQAEVLADEQARLIDERLATKTDLGELATSVKRAMAELATKDGVKRDIAELAASVKKDIVELAASVKADIAELATKEGVKADIAQLATKESVKADIAQLATKESVKADIAQLATKDSVKADISGLATKEGVKAEISEAKADILKWMFGAIGFQTLVLLGAAVALAKALIEAAGAALNDGVTG